jgi:hypothetical protein
VIKFIVAAIWICGVTIGSMIYAFSGAEKAGEVEAAPATLFGGIDYVKTDILSVPIVRDAAVQGYFIARFVYTAEQKRLAQLTVPAESMLIDEVFTYLYSNPMIDFTDASNIDIDGFRTGLRDAMNKRIGEDLVKDVMIEQIDYLSKQEIRDNAMRRRAGQKVPSLDRGHQKLDIPEEKKDGGHGEKPAAH